MQFGFIKGRSGGYNKAFYGNNNNERNEGGYKIILDYRNISDYLVNMCDSSLENRTLIYDTGVDSLLDPFL